MLCWPYKDLLWKENTDSDTQLPKVGVELGFLKHLLREGREAPPSVPGVLSRRSQEESVSPRTLWVPHSKLAAATPLCWWGKGGSGRLSHLFQAMEVGPEMPQGSVPIVQDSGRGSSALPLPPLNRAGVPLYLFYWSNVCLKSLGKTVLFCKHHHQPQRRQFWKPQSQAGGTPLFVTGSVFYILFPPPAEV